MLDVNIRSRVSDSTEVDPFWSLSQPLRQSCAMLLDCIVGDVGTALEDPLCLEQTEPVVRRPCALDLHFHLPSPQSTPKTKQLSKRDIYPPRPIPPSSSLLAIHTSFSGKR